MKEDPTTHFAAYVSPVKGRLVRRYGTPENLGQIAGTPEVDPALVIPLTHEEWRLYGREYRTALSEGSLAKRTAKDWLEAEAAAEKAAIAADEERKAKTKAEAAPAPSDETTTKKGSTR